MHDARGILDIVRCCEMEQFVWLSGLVFLGMDVRKQIETRGPELVQLVLQRGYMRGECAQLVLDGLG